MRKTTTLMAIAGLALTASMASAQVFSVSPGLPIPATGTLGEMTPSTLEVSGGPSSVGVMRVTLNLNHTFTGDLDIVLVSPDGQRYLKLTSDNGGTGENMIDTVFDDFAADSITAGVAPFTGSFRPEGGDFSVDLWTGTSVLPPNFSTTLADFGGINSNGTWTLLINDDANLDAGILNSWSIEFVDATQLAGFGGATAANVCPVSGTSLVTVRIVPANNPASTNITARADLSGVGGSATQNLFDDGTNGDVTAGDNVFSYLATIPSTAPTGPNSITWNASDAQGRTASGTTSMNISCTAFTDNCFDATATFGPGQWGFDTTIATIDGTAACTGNGSNNAWLRYRATRNGEARVATCTLATFDTVLAVYDGCDGNVIACDDDGCVEPGLQSDLFFPITANTEYLIRISGFGAGAGAGEVLIEEQGGRLFLTAAIDQDPVPACGTALLTATVVPGTDPASTNITVTGDLTELGLGASETFYDDGTNGDQAAGDNVFSLSITAPSAEDFFAVDMTATDAEGRISTDTVFFETGPSDCTLSILLADAQPDPVVEGQPLLVTAQLSLPTNPPSTNLSVTADLSEVGGSFSQQMFDDGTNGDLISGDGIYSFEVIPTEIGFQFIDMTATDGEGRIANGFAGVQVIATPLGACCTGVNCQIIRQALCEQQGGLFQGPGSSCGGAAYEASPSSSAFVAINTTGTNLGVVGDDVGGTIFLPFTFNYNGTDYSEVYANSNGLLSFGGVNSNAFTNQPFPTAAAPNDIVGVLWDDLEVDLVTNPIGGIYFQEFGTAPNRTFVISWEGLPQLAQTDDNNFQVVFTEGSSNMTFRYGLITAGIDASVGQEDASGTVGLNYDVNSLGAGGVAIELAAGILTNPCDGVGGCGDIDFNNDGLFPTDEDIVDFFTVNAGGACSTGQCDSIDFNGDGLFPSDDDLIAFFRVLGGGDC